MIRSTLNEVIGVAGARTDTHRKLRDRLTFVLVATIGVDAVCAVLAYLFERSAKQTDVKTIGSALFWTSTQLLTVSSSVKNPITTGGRVLDVVMEAYALIVIATLAGALGTFLQKRGEEDADRAAARGR
ncbi:MAG: uncharacterized protein JWN32_2370 [Solirubrobacterales bacterium]|nr:uncharacterized protein [Solirubrobacterales bacterium]